MSMEDCDIIVFSSASEIIKQKLSDLRNQIFKEAEKYYNSVSKLLIEDYNNYIKVQESKKDQISDKSIITDATSFVNLIRFSSGVVGSTSYLVIGNEGVEILGYNVKNFTGLSVIIPKNNFIKYGYLDPTKILIQINSLLFPDFEIQDRVNIEILNGHINIKYIKKKIEEIGTIDYSDLSSLSNLAHYNNITSLIDNLTSGTPFKIGKIEKEEVRSFLKSFSQSKITLGDVELCELVHEPGDDYLQLNLFGLNSNNIKKKFKLNLSIDKNKNFSQATLLNFSSIFYYFSIINHFQSDIIYTIDKMGNILFLSEPKFDQKSQNSFQLNLNTMNINVINENRKSLSSLKSENELEDDSDDEQETDELEDDGVDEQETDELQNDEVQDTDELGEEVVQSSGEFGEDLDDDDFNSRLGVFDLPSPEKENIKQPNSSFGELTSVEDLEENVFLQKHIQYDQVAEKINNIKKVLGGKNE